MSFYINFGGYPTGSYQAGGFMPPWARPAPPPPPPPVEIVVEHDGRRHRLLVDHQVLTNLLRFSAEYEAQLATRQQQRSSFDDARTFLRDLTGMPSEPLNRVVLRAKRLAHPDTGGTAELFRRVTDAERALIDAGLLR